MASFRGRDYSLGEDMKDAIKEYRKNPNLWWAKRIKDALGHDIFMDFQEFLDGTDNEFSQAAAEIAQEIDPTLFIGEGDIDAGRRA